MIIQKSADLSTLTTNLATVDGIVDSLLLYAQATGYTKVSKALTFTGNNTTVVTPIFTLTGMVEALMFAEVTTVIGSNHTTAHLRINDQSSTTSMTESGAGLNLNGTLAGSLIRKSALVATALVLSSAASRVFVEPAAFGNPLLLPFIVGKKTGAVTQIEYVYTTTETPTSGAMTWYALYRPFTSDGALAAA